MKRFITVLILKVVFVINFNSHGWTQEIKAKNAQSWEVTGKVQLQYLYNSDVVADATKTNNGFRIRRARLQVAGKLSDWISTKFQIEVRDNNPSLKDAEGKIRLSKTAFIRFGQFKVPVWREELRSSSGLLLVERSAAAEFLADFHLSSRNVGLEFGAAKNGFLLAVNVSNGAGEGGREDAGRSKSDFVNNGKLITARIDVPAGGGKFKVGISGAANQVGNEIGGDDNKGTIWALAPDFGIYLSAGNNGNFDVEGGVAFGSISSDFTGEEKDQEFTLFDVTARWMKKLESSSAHGVDGFEFAAGVTYLEPNSEIDDDESVFFRFGPAVYFGKRTRIQFNGEVESPAATDAETIILFRTQATFNF